MRNETIDVMKGIAIILVILGHVVIRIDGMESWLGIFIWSFFMQVFFVVSGFLSYGKTSDNWIGRRFLMLMIPYFVWMTFRYFFFDEGGNILVYLSNVAVDPSLGLWFIYVLFECSLVFYFSKGNPWIMLLVITVLNLILICFVHSSYYQLFGCRAVSWWGLFFVIGSLVSMYKDKLKEFVNIYSIVGTVLFLGLVFLPFNRMTGFEAFTEGDYLYSIYKLFLALFGIAGVYLLARAIGMSRRLGYVLSFLGMMTLGIYCFPGISTAASLCEFGGIFGIFLLTVMTLIIDIFVVYVLDRIPIVNNLFLGLNRLSEFKWKGI